MAPSPSKRRKRNPNPSTPTPSSQIDYLSLLPDCLLTTILFLLPIKSAVQTTLLSTRFRHLWHASPLALSDSDIHRGSSPPFPSSRSRDNAFRIDAVNSVLSSHSGPAASHFRLLHTDLPDNWIDWLRILADKKIQEISLRLRVPRDVPNSLFHCTSLHTLHLERFSLTRTAIDTISEFQRLHDLTLAYVSVCEEALFKMVSQCPALENVSLMQLIGVKKMTLRSKSLKSVCVSQFWQFELDELVIEEGPDLAKLTLKVNAGRARIRVANAPVLEELQLLGINLRGLQLGPPLCPEREVGSSSFVNTVKILAIDVHFELAGQVKVVIDVLRCLPFLETLYIQSSHLARSNRFDLSWCQVEEPIHCLEHHLKVVMFRAYSGMGMELEFAKFLIAKGKHLKRVEFHCVAWCGERWIQDMQTLLCLEYASNVAPEILFMKEKKSI